MIVSKLLIILFLSLVGHEPFSSASPSLEESKEYHMLESIVVEFFRFREVSSIVYVTCPERIEGYQIIWMIRHFINCGFSISVCYNSSTFELAASLRNGILMDIDCYHSQEILERAYEERQFKPYSFWLIIQLEEESLINVFDSVFIPSDGEVMVLMKCRSCNNWSLVDVYKITSTKPLISSVVSTEITSATSLVSSLREYGPAIPKRKSLDGIYFKAGLVIAFPDIFTTIDDLSIRHIDTISKVSYPIIQNMGCDLNFKLNLLQFDNYGWSTNGTFDGLMGHFQRDNLEISANGIFLRGDRIPIVEYLGELFEFRAHTIFKQPPLSAVTNIFALTFSKEVWWLIGFFLITSTLLMIAQVAHPFYNVNLDYFDSFLFAWGAICQQGFFEPMVTKSGRILIFTTFITSIFLFTSFSANIVALLQSPSDTIATIQDLTKSSLDVGAQDTMYNKVYFKESSDPITQEFFNKKILPQGEKAFMRPNIGIEKIRTGLYAFQVEAQTGYAIISKTFNEQEKCGLKELEPFRLPITALAVRKNFPFTEKFRQRIRYQREVGLMKRESLRWLSQKPECENKVGGFVSIGFVECRYILISLCVGAILSLIILLIELLYYRYVDEKEISGLESAQSSNEQEIDF